MSKSKKIMKIFKIVILLIIISILVILGISFYSKNAKNKNDDSSSKPTPNIINNDNALTCKVEGKYDDKREKIQLTVELDDNYQITKIYHQKDVIYNTNEAYQKVKKEEEKNKNIVNFDDENKKITYSETDNFKFYIGKTYTSLVHEMSGWDCSEIKLATNYTCSREQVIDEKTPFYTSATDFVLVTNGEDNYVTKVQHVINYVFNDKAKYEQYRMPQTYGNYSIVQDDTKLTQIWSEDWSIVDQNGQPIKADILTYINGLENDGFTCLRK